MMSPSRIAAKMFPSYVSPPRGAGMEGCGPFQFYGSNGVDVRFTGDIVLDTGRVIPVEEIVYATYSEYDFCMAWNSVVHDYLAE